ncbi:MAG: DNA-directed RNA polymerase subunit omega [Pyrinomonadaceae bacterium]|nr:DNA-directed RNA polymerase subunit omega [Pyrinomonadaceae bacterium]MCX7640687.1 DNA-directed RNA polymerase subunit omega [Pyrinomonadaceae bacterium]MDW8305391.1 DNA-directed RNA polymerase subunit omega [Acidobacteriota bacterium]
MIEKETLDTQKENKIPEIDSKYRLVIIAAQRAKQLQKGAHPRVNLNPRKTKPTVIALEEIKQGKVNFEILDET